MITLLLRGGLGNQMFQYASGLYLARQNHTTLVLDTLFLETRIPGRKGRTYRSFSLDIFTLAPDVRITWLSRLARKFSLSGIWLAADFVAIAARRIAGSQKLVTQRGHTFDSSLRQRRGNLLLFGYWQSESYFVEASEAVAQAFRLKEPLNGAALVVQQEIASSCSISLHVRRGDYVDLDMVQTDLSYYTRAVQYIAERLKAEEAKQAKVFVFSDDTNWCKEHVSLPLKTVYVDDSSAGPKAGFHLQLMSLCSHNIIANSTFSWWGAWLNQHREKIVVAPKQWYTGRDTENIVPASWVVL